MLETDQELEPNLCLGRPFPGTQRRDGSPPATVTVSAVMQLASSEHRKDTMPAQSSGSPNLGNKKNKGVKIKQAGPPDLAHRE